MRLSSSVNCGGLGLPAWQTAICVALQKYGMFLRDNGGALGIYGLNPINGGTTWSSVGLSGNSAAFSSAFPWGQLQVLNPPSASSSTTPPPSGSPSGQAMPTGDVASGGHTWHQIVAEGFTKDAALGSWNDSGTLTSCPSNAYAVMYTGASGAKWAAYPKCYKDTYQKRAYRSDQVLSVHDGMLDFWLHVVDGHPAGANPVPYYPNGTLYQTYGRYEIRFKTTTTALEEYYQAWLLWPSGAVSGGGGCAESDFPESALNLTSVSYFAHYCNSTGNHQDSGSKTVDRTQWHTYTQEWMPGKRNYYLDGTLIGSSTNNVVGANGEQERWQLQTETKTTCDQVTPITCHDDGHLLVDWAVVYSY